MKTSVAGWGASALLLAIAPGAEEVVRQEIPSRFAPLELVKRTVQAQLSPQGRFVVLAEKGTVIVIDEASRILAAAEAMEQIEFPPPHIQLSVGLETGGRARSTGASRNATVAGPVGTEGFVPFPSGYQAPRIGRTGGGYLVVPAHPTGFRRRAVGQSMEVRPTVNADGSVGVEVNAENVEFSGFIAYGSPVVPAGTATVLPLASGLVHAAAFQSYVDGVAKLPVLETTRVSTSVVLQPEVEGNQVRVRFYPQVRLESEREGVRQAEDVPLRNLGSGVTIPVGKAVRLSGFAGAPAEFNELLFAPKGGAKGLTRMVLKAEVRAAEMAAPQ